MFFREDNTYKDILGKSVEQWLDDMSRHDDIAVRCGVKAANEYIDSLKKQIKVLEEKNALKDTYLKKVREK